jgi:hypothetical protein
MINTNSELILVYRNFEISIYTTYEILIENMKTLKLDKRRIKDRIKYFKKINIEKDKGSFNFSDGARTLVQYLLYKNQCVIKIENERIIKSYIQRTFRDNQCLHRTNYIFEDESLGELKLEFINTF